MKPQRRGLLGVRIVVLVADEPRPFLRQAGGEPRVGVPVEGGQYLRAMEMRNRRHRSDVRGAAARRHGVLRSADDPRVARAPVLVTLHAMVFRGRADGIRPMKRQILSQELLQHRRGAVRLPQAVRIDRRRRRALLRLDGARRPARRVVIELVAPKVRPSGKASRGGIKLRRQDLLLEFLHVDLDGGRSTDSCRGQHRERLDELRNVVSGERRLRGPHGGLGRLLHHLLRGGAAATRRGNAQCRHHPTFPLLHGPSSTWYGGNPASSTRAAPFSVHSEKAGKNGFR